MNGYLINEIPLKVDELPREAAHFYYNVKTQNYEQMGENTSRLHILSQLKRMASTET